MLLLGYIRAYKPELKVKEYELYQGVYCSLCRSLGRRYSPFAQLFLSYDFTFLALLRLAGTAQPPEIRQKRCPYKPFKKCPGCTKNREIDLCADAVVLTAYYKAKDALQDAGLLKKAAALLLLPPLALLRRKARKASPRLEELIARAMRAQAITEQNRGTAYACLDEAAHPSASALAAMVCLGECDPSRRQQLERIGYCVGRWVYLMDAADDLTKDVKRGDFNPFIPHLRAKGQTQARHYAREALHMTLGEAAQALEEAPFERFQPIIENIIYDGLTAQMQVVLSPKGKKAGGVGVAQSL